MSKGPPLFPDIGKKAREILYKDYSCDRKFSVSTQTQDGLALTSSALQKESHSVGDVAAQFKYKNAVIDVKVDSQPSMATTLTLTDIMPSLKSIASVKLPDYNSAKLKLQYFHEHAALSSSVSFNKSPVFDVSATCGTPSTVIGVEAGYDTSISDFTKYNVGISMIKPDSCASVILAEKGDLVRASYVQYLDQARTSTVVEFTNRFSEDGNSLTVGGSYAVDDLTLVKLKLNNQGNFGALLVICNQIFTNSTLSVLLRTTGSLVSNHMLNCVIFHACCLSALETLGLNVVHHFARRSLISTIILVPLPT